MNVFTNKNWLNKVFYSSCFEWYGDLNYKEAVCAIYHLHPLEDQIASINKLIFDPKKAAAMYFWYKSADKTDKSIIKYFEEYKNCVDKTHQQFNSNYGVYAYKQHGIQRCIDALIERSNSRQACFCINNNSAMAPDSIDKLCTNAVQFFIRHDKLIMVVQMRSSNMLTLLPYDFFVFCIWYAQVYNKLIQVYHNLKVSNICIQVASLHYYKAEYNSKCIDNAPITNLTHVFDYRDMIDHNFENILEEKLIKFLND